MSKYPDAFTTRMRSQLGSAYEAFIAALDLPMTTSVRTNPAKYQVADSTLPLGDAILWATNGHYLSERPSFTFDPLFHAGAYYVQESSSMFVERAFHTIDIKDKSLRVLDLCAAPGGKTTHLLSLLNKDSLLVANELIANRNHILRQNLSRWGHTNIVVTQNKAEDMARLGEFFDVILVDAPCSGEGLFRKDKAAIDEWSESNVNLCAERQRDILSHISQCLKPGGYIIYSTCTYEPSENMEHIRTMTQGGAFTSVPIAGASSFAEVTTLQEDKAVGYAFYPHLTRGEGFFISLLKKEGQHTERLKQDISKPLIDKTTAELMPLLGSMLHEPERFTALKHQTYYNILPTIFMPDYKRLAQQLYIRQAGVPVGEIKGKDLIPAHELALSLAMRADFPHLDLDRTQAIAYLKAETIQLPTEHRGWMTVRYKDLNLGFVKVLPNRINSYMPKDWRILRSVP
jgi:16S rRNA C967 or C1407 C5-methylase (RsmB/RsmF family)/NOL1/NOP2/fmu family ribosome biogenesis protein